MKENELKELWEHLHANPETSMYEVKTTDYMMKLFQNAGFHPVAFQSIPGFYVEVGVGQPKIGLRADMDALLQEVDGKLRANHSCGHDAHMTIVTGVMHQLKNMENELTGTVRAIFQPAEEKDNGAVKVVEEGIIDDLDYLFGVHVRPVNEIAFPACAPSIQHGACLFVKGKIEGVDHHGARPQEGVNAIEVGMAIAQQLQHIHVSPQIPASIKLTNFHAGTDNLNIIPGNASFGIDVRAQTNDVMDEMKMKLATIVDHLSSIYQIPITYEFAEDVPAAVMNLDAERVMHDAIETVLGKEHVRKVIMTPGSDDFHNYAVLHPALKATMLGLGANVTPGLHHPEMTFDHRAIKNGIDILVQACLSVK